MLPHSRRSTRDLCGWVCGGLRCRLPSWPGRVFLVRPRCSAIALDRLAQPLHCKFDGSRPEVAPDLEFSLELLLWETLEIFPHCPPGGRALPDEFLANERVWWHGPALNA